MTGTELQSIGILFMLLGDGNHRDRGHSIYVANG
jgi:hypothetical protein